MADESEEELSVRAKMNWWNRLSPLHPRDLTVQAERAWVSESAQPTSQSALSHSEKTQSVKEPTRTLTHKRHERVKTLP